VRGSAVRREEVCTASGTYPATSSVSTSPNTSHPVAASLLWSIAILAVFAPFATALYRGRTTE
jgi:hypothetical protein